MSVDLNQLAAHLPSQEQEAVKKAYHKRAINSTTVFVLCFFLGWCGAHRFYLGQLGRGFARLLVPLVLAAAVVAGIALAWPASTIALIAIPLALLALIWEILDLFRVDAEVHAHNLALAEELIANSLLGDKSVERAAADRLDSLLHETHAREEAAPQEQPDAVSAAYDATTVTEISADSEAAHAQQAAAEAPRDWSTTETYSVDNAAETPDTPAAVGTDAGGIGGIVESAGTAEGAGTSGTLGAVETAGAAAAGAFIAEEVMREHAVSGYSTTDSVETIRETPAPAPAMPSWAEATAQTWPDHPLLEPQPDAFAGYYSAAAPTGTDLTDRASVEEAKPIADVGTVGASPLHIALPDDMAASTPGAEDTEGTLVLLPDDTAATQSGSSAATEAGFAEYSAQPQPEAYVPPTVPVITVPAAAAAAEVLGEQERDTAPYRAVPMSQAAAPAEPQADLATYGAAAVGGALAGSAGPTEYEEAHSAQVEPEHHQMRRIRVVRQVKVNGEVVEETSAEEFVPADADPEPVRARLQEMLRQQAAGRMPSAGGQA